MRKRIFCDFDGTITIEDVGNSIFAKYTNGIWKNAVEKWKNNEITSKECLEIECAATKVTQDELKIFVDSHKIDPFFEKFAYYCKNNDIPLILLSDGLDFYIDRILKKYKLEWLDFYSNNLNWENGKMVPFFPYYYFRFSY